MNFKKIWGCRRRKAVSLRLPLSFALLLLVASPPLYAADYGLDTLALAKMDPKVIAEELPPGWNLGVLEHTFGDPLPNLEAVAKTGKLGGFRVHLRNGTCYRNGVCEAIEPKLNDLTQLSKDAKKYEAFHQRYPALKCFISHTLEHDEKNAATVQTWIDTVKKAAPSCEVVNSVFTGASGRSALNEQHGNRARGDIVSNDGQSLFDSDSPAYRENGKVLVLGWFHRMNGRVSGEKTFTPPSRRSLWPTRDNLRQAVRLLKPQAAKPASKPGTCKVLKNFSGGELWKTNAESYGTADPREDRPLFISLSRSPQMNLLAPSGAKVGCLKYYGPYTQPNLSRSYAGTCSGDSAAILMDKAKGEWIYIQDGNTCILTNAIRRKGYFRE